MKKLLPLLTLLLLLLLAMSTAQQEPTITTFYPASYGEYCQLQLSADSSALGDDKLTSVVFFDSEGKPEYTITYSEGKVESLSVFSYKEDDPATGQDESTVIESVQQYEVMGDINTLTKADLNSDGVIDEIDIKLLEESLKSFVDTNGDGVVDVCADTDNDAVIDAIDNCPLILNPEQSDSDTDGFGDACDNCPDDPDNDIDQDGICGDVDNCPLENPQGLDADSDGCTDTIEGLYDNLQSIEIQAGVKNSLLAKVSNALSSLTGESVNAAINQLNAFINQVEAQSGKKISQEDADVLAGFAQNIIQVNDGDGCEKMPRAVAHCFGVCAPENDPHNIRKWRSAASTAYSWGKCGSCTSEERDAQLENAKEICVARMYLQCGRMGPGDYILVENQNQFGGSYTFCADCECGQSGAPSRN